MSTICCTAICCTSRSAGPPSCVEGPGGQDVPGGRCERSRSLLESARRLRTVSVSEAAARAGQVDDPAELAARLGVARDACVDLLEVYPDGLVADDVDLSGQGQALGQVEVRFSSAPAVTALLT